MTRLFSLETMYHTMKGMIDMRYATDSPLDPNLLTQIYLGQHLIPPSRFCQQWNCLTRLPTELPSSLVLLDISHNQVGLHYLSLS